MQAGASEEIVGGMKQGKAIDESVRQAFTLQPRPRPSRVNLLEMIAAMELMRQFEVMEDSEDGLGNFHEERLLS